MVAVHKSKIHGLGLYATTDVEKDTLVIEYGGEVRKQVVEFTTKKQRLMPTIGVICGVTLTMKTKG